MFDNVRSKSTVNEGINSLSDYEIVKLAKAGENGCINANVMGFIKSKDVGYGSSILLVLDNKKMLSLPKRYTDKFGRLTDSDIEMLMSGTMKLISVEEFDTPKGKTCNFTLQFVNENGFENIRF